ncbi:DUF3244 domain-containing protein [Geofilum sp. OHC36d9]|uniref:DUF3244 domain-containing protein n=1 Tax=Geofilum sp. OHC36d9 TaxID=3458413 RepID=UPI0040347204
MKGTFIYIMVLLLSIPFSLGASNPDRETDKIESPNPGRILKTLSSATFVVDVYESFLSVFSASYVGEAGIEVVNSSGSVLIDDYFSFDTTNECLIDISSLAAGEYSVCITYGSTVDTVIFTVE